MRLGPAQSGAVGACIGGAVAALAIAAELDGSASGLVALQRGSVLVWVVESLPVVFGVLGYALGERSLVVHEAAAAAPPAARAAPPPAPTVPPTWVSAAPAALSGKLLLVDGTPPAPALAARLHERGLAVVHVSDSASGSLAREAEAPDVAVVRVSSPGAAALVSELGRHGVPVVVLDAPEGIRLPRQARSLADLGDVERAVAELIGGGP